MRKFYYIGGLPRSGSTLKDNKYPTSESKVRNDCNFFASGLSSPSKRQLDKTRRS